MNNDKNWDDSREAYLSYRDAKRKLNTVNEDFTRVSTKLEKAFIRYNKVENEALTRIEDDSQCYKLIDAFRNLRNTKMDYNRCRDALSEALSDFRGEEISYSVVIFKGLRDFAGLNIVNLSNIFGIYRGNISRWMEKGEDKELKRIYEEEYEINTKDE